MTRSASGGHVGCLPSPTPAQLHPETQAALMLWTHYHLHLIGLFLDSLVLLLAGVHAAHTARRLRQTGVVYSNVESTHNFKHSTIRSAGIALETK